MILVISVVCLSICSNPHTPWSSTLCRYWSRPALIFWPPSCRWKIHCQAGLQHCIETLQHFVGKAAELLVLSASNHQAKCGLSQQNAMLPEMAHIHTAASHNNIREDQDTYKLATMMWAMFEMQLLRHPNNLHAYMQLVARLSLQSLASQIVGTLCKQVSHSSVPFPRRRQPYLTLSHTTW